MLASFWLYQLLVCSFASLLQTSILWVLIMDSRWGALSPPSSTSLTSARRLTLSFPFQIELNIMLFASFKNSLSRHIMLARYRRIGTMKVLTIWILPITVRSLHLQILNFSLIDLIKSSQFNFRLAHKSYVKWIPRILTDVLLSRRLTRWSGNKFEHPPSNIISDLSWFILRPEHSPKSSKRSRNFVKKYHLIKIQSNHPQKFPI